MASSNAASLPVFDFSKFQKGNQEECKQSAEHITAAFKTFGFVYLINHNIPESRIDELFEWSKKFFYLPEKVRTDPNLIRPSPGQNSFVARGYGPVGSEELSQNYQDDSVLQKERSVPDAKDMFEMGPEKGPGAEREPNRYPPEDVIPGFHDFTQEFFWEAHALGLDILRCIATGLGLPENYFASYHEDADNLFRLIRYPPVERAAMLAGTTARTTPHTDYGSITILFQDNVGGLEVEDPAKPGTYIKATPVKGSVIVNIADFLMRWSNDNLKSNLHRVVEPPADKELGDGMELTKERFSIPYFVQADRKKIVECIEILKGDGARYPPISAGDYLAQRTNAAFKTFK